MLTKQTAFLLLMCFGILSACQRSKTTEPVGFQEYPVLVDSVSAPDTVAINEPFLARVWAIVGPDLCHKFKRFEISTQGSDIEVVVIGERKIGGEPCADMVATIHGRGFAVNPPFSVNEITLIFHRRGGGFIKHSVVVNQ